MDSVTSCLTHTSSSIAVYSFISSVIGSARIIYHLAIAIFIHLPALCCNYEKYGKKLKNDIKQIGLGVAELFIVIGPLLIAFYLHRVKSKNKKESQNNSESTSPASTSTSTSPIPASAPISTSVSTSTNRTPPLTPILEPSLPKEFDYETESRSILEVDPSPFVPYITPTPLPYFKGRVGFKNRGRNCTHNLKTIIWAHLGFSFAEDYEKALKALEGLPDPKPKAKRLKEIPDELKPLEKMVEELKRRDEEFRKAGTWNFQNHEELSSWERKARALYSEEWGIQEDLRKYNEAVRRVNNTKRAEFVLCRLREEGRREPFEEIDALTISDHCYTPRQHTYKIYTSRGEAEKDGGKKLYECLYNKDWRVIEVGIPGHVFAYIRNEGTETADRVDNFSDGSPREKISFKEIYETWKIPETWLKREVIFHGYNINPSSDDSS